MRSRYRINHLTYAHFITCTVVEWLPVFTTSQACRILTNSLEFSRAQKNLKIYAWVILDNHMHAIVSAPELSKTISAFKSFTAHAIVEYLESTRRYWLLSQLHHCRLHDKVPRCNYQVWQEGSHPQSIQNDEMFFQKIRYIHLNPVRRGLVVDPEHWVYSSAHERMKGAYPVMKCNSWWDRE